MALIIVLIAVAFEHYIGIADHVRQFNWFTQYQLWLENRLARYKFWSGPAGIIVTLSAPLLIIALLMWFFSDALPPLAWILALVILIFTLGPQYLNPQLDDLISHLENYGENTTDEIVAEYSFERDTANNDQKLLENILIESNERLFAVLFWFVVLGPVGALLYRLTVMLHQQQRGIHGEYASASEHLYNILNWPSARMVALGNALMGNMVDAIEAWQGVEKQSFEVNEAVICATGLSALNYKQPEDNESVSLEDRIYWLKALQGLLNRNLLVWLTILGIMTLSGWLG